MRYIDGEQVEAALDMAGLVEALREGFRSGCEMPLRQRYTIAKDGEPDAQLVLMPAWRSGDSIGVKIVNIVPGNGARGEPAVKPLYALFDERTGDPQAIIDGRTLTLRRTGAASALAADYLARRDARRLLMVGAGALAPYLVEAHSAVRPIDSVVVWARSADKADLLASKLRKAGFAASSSADLQEAVRAADIVSCATLANDPLVRGEWLRPGTHVDLVGGFTPTMREADDEAARRASVYLDKRDAALKEAGDIIQPIANGVLTPEDIVGDLFDLAAGACRGRRSADEITLFKSVGMALEDLVAASLLVRRLSDPGRASPRPRKDAAL